MRPIKWNKKNEVFVPELDAEHRNMFALVEELRSSAAHGGERVHQLLNELAAVAEEHFRHEERVMRESQYPLLSWHQKQHDTVRKRLAPFVRETKQDDPAALAALVGFLANWLRDHTSLPDRMMAAYLRNYRRLQSRMAS